MSAVLHACTRQLLVRLLNVGGVVTQVLLAWCSSALRLGLLSSLSTTNVSQGLCTLQWLNLWPIGPLLSDLVPLCADGSRAPSISGFPQP